MSKFVSKKSLFVCLAISLVLIIAGAFVFGFCGFNTDSTTKDYQSVSIADYYTLRKEADSQKLKDFCESKIEESGFKVVDIKNSELSAYGVVWEFVVTGEANSETFVSDLQLAIGNSGIEYTDDAVVVASYHEVVNQPYYEYIWRSAIGAGVAAVLLFLYVAIRFRLETGITALIACVHDVLLTLAIVAILRIPVGVTFIGVAAFSLLLSAILNLSVTGRISRELSCKKDKTKAAQEGVAAGGSVAESTPAQSVSVNERVAVAVKNNVKRVFIVSIVLAAMIVVLGVVGVFVGFDLTSFMLCALMAVIISTYSSLVLAPSIYAGIKEKFDANRAKKAKYNYSSEKEKEKAAKAAKKQEPAGESN